VSTYAIGQCSQPPWNAIATTELTGAARLGQQLNPEGTPPSRKAGCSTLGWKHRAREDALPWHGWPLLTRDHRRGHRSDHRHHLGFAAAEPYRVLLTQRALGRRPPIHGRSKVSARSHHTEPEKRKKCSDCACEDTARLDGVKSMRKLMLATASAVVLAMAGAGIGSAEPYSSPTNPPGSATTRQGP